MAEIDSTKYTPNVSGKQIRREHSALSSSIANIERVRDSGLPPNTGLLVSTCKYMKDVTPNTLRISSVSTSNYLKLHLNLIGLQWIPYFHIIRDATAVYISLYLWFDLSALSIRLLMANHPLTAWEEDLRLVRSALI